MFSLKLLGAVSLVGPDGVVTGPATQRHRLALLALLAAAHPRTVSRDRILAFLWPERDTESARRLLNQAVHVLRKTLGPEAVLSEADGIRIDAAVVESDLFAFEEALEAGEFERGVGLYAGPFLDGFFLGEAPEFERWVSAERQRLADRYGEALETLASAAAADGDFATSVRWWKARAGHDPYDSRVALLLMEALDANGNRAGALQAAAVHRQLLEEEFGVEPPPELLALVDRLRRKEDASPALGHAVAPDTARERREDAPAGWEAPEEEIPSSGAGSPAGASDRTTAPRTPRTRAALRYGAATLIGLVALVSAFALRFGNSDGSDPLGSSLAVLPLPILTGDPTDQALADGLAEELINVLWTMGGLRVIGAGSVFALRDRGVDARTVADLLGVGSVLEVSLERGEPFLRVRVRLVDGRDGSTRWAASYDRAFGDVFAIQDEIARAVARELGGQLGTVSDPPPVRPATRNIAAYELFLRGSDPRIFRTEEAARRAEANLRQAIELDSLFAAPYAVLAYLQFRSWYDSPIEPSESMFERLAAAEELARKAIELDGSLGLAHGSMALIRMNALDFTSAEAHLERAIALDPDRGTFHEHRVTLYLWTGRPREALAAAERALELDPLSAAANAELARALMANDRCNEALRRLEGLVDLEPPLLRAAPVAAQCYAQEGRWPEAIAAMTRGLGERRARGHALVGYLHARAGNEAEARAIHDELVARWRPAIGDALAVAISNLGWGDHDGAFEWIERSLDDLTLKPAPGPFTLMDPIFRELHDDLRFEGIRARLGLQNR